MNRGKAGVALETTRLFCSYKWDEAFKQFHWCNMFDCNLQFRHLSS